MSAEGEEGALFDFDHICSILVKEPFGLSKAEIGELTHRDLVQIYFRPERK